MPQKYGDAVVLIQKQRDGSLTRVNAHVLRSFVQPDGAETFNPKQVELTRALKDSNGKAFPGGEYLDLAFPTPGLPEPITSRSLENIYRHAASVPPYKDGAWIGWDVPAKPSSPKLKAFLMANFKEETGNETPEDCAIRLLTKVKATKK